jgi:hypothetical protein
MNQVRLGDIEAAHFPREVFLSDREPAPELTALFHGYTVATAEPNSFATNYPGVVLNSFTTGRRNTNQAIVLSYKLKPGTILRLVVFGLILSVVLSLVIWLKTWDLQTAFAAFGAMTLFLTIPLNVIFWMTE